MFHKRQNSLSRYFALEGNIARRIGKIDKPANCLAGHGRAGLKIMNVLGPGAVNVLDVAGYGRSGPETSWIMPSLQGRDRYWTGLGLDPDYSKFS